MSNEFEYVNETTIKRLAKEVSDIFKNPLKEEKIYYIHDDNNMLKGYALIIGPEDTPYEYGNYLFKFKFPDNYPVSPPKVTFHTSDELTRFHPNLYKSGKVCLSILNTWFGDSWTSCLTIKSILLTIRSILTSKSLLNEPGIRDTHYDIKNYDLAIQYSNYKTAIYHMLNNTALNNPFKELFFNIIKTEYINNKEAIINKITKLSNDPLINNKLINITFYKFCHKLSYKKLLEDFNSLDL